MLGIDLERLFRAPGQIAVLRALWKAPAALTGRQVQELAGVHNRTVMRSLQDLTQLGVVQRRAAGRANLYTLKRSHRAVRDLVDPLFKAEQSALERFVKALARVLRGHCLSAVLYGSVARGEAKPVSDVDLLVVVEDEQAVELFELEVQDKAERLVREGWSAMLEINLRTREKLVRKWSTPFLKQIRRQGLMVVGQTLDEVQRGQGS